MIRAPQPALTHCGLTGVHAIPYGVHMCHFYRSRAELAHVLVPFIAAGLQSNERCFCVLPERALAEMTLRELQECGVDVERALRRGALLVRGGGTERPSPVEVAEWWLTKERRALDEGYQGIRIAGNTTSVAPGEWDRHMEYEAEFHRRVWAQRIVTLCAYDLAYCAKGRPEIIRRHSCVLDRPDEGWQLLTGTH